MEEESALEKLVSMKKERGQVRREAEAVQLSEEAEE